MKILIVPDSFKGTLSSAEVCECIKNGILQTSDAEITALPFSDGGEGFAECMSNICNGKTLYTTCTDIYGKNRKAPIFTYNKTAVIDCASASSMQEKKDVMNATSYGTGELINFAVSNGFNNIILGLGGTGCCDGGAGVLAALGVRFKNIDGEIICTPRGNDLEKIDGVDFTNCVKNINFTYACDVNNTYFGKNGAAYVFAPQKGADKNDVEKLDNGLKMLNAFLPNDISNVSGAGAAGGICGALYSVYGGKIRSGFEILSDTYKLEEKIKSSDLVITGEGKTDKQTLMGKLPYKISCLCSKYNKKCIVLSGIIDGVSLGDRMISLVDENTTAEQAMENPVKVLTYKAKNILK